MNRKTVTPEATPAPTAQPTADLMREYERRQDAAHLERDLAAGAKPPAKLSKLAAAMQIVDSNVTEIQALGLEIDTLHTKYAPNTVWDLATKEGEKECDLARKESRAVRLKIQNLRDTGKKLLNGLKGELEEAAEGDIARAQAIEDNAKGQQEAKARKEQDRIDRHEKNIQAIALMAEGIGAMTSEQIQARGRELAAIIVDESYEEYEPKAQRKHKEVAELLAEAFIFASRIEQDKREADERAAAAAKELADLQARQAEQQAKEAEHARIKGYIDQMKDVPARLEGADLNIVREALRLHKLAEPKAEVFGDQLEMAELVHFKVTKELEELEYMLGMAAEAPADVEPTPVPTLPPVNVMGNGVPTISVGFAVPDVPTVEGRMTMDLVDTFMDLDPNPARGDEPINDEAESRLPIRAVAEQAALSEPDPFSAPAPRPRLAPRGVVASLSGSAGGSASKTSADDRGPITDAFELTPGDAADVPDLLKAAQEFMRAWNVEPNVHGCYPELDEAASNLAAAVDFATEFAD